MPRNQGRFAHILFDWDGTLLDSAQPGYRAFRKTFRDLQIPFDRRTYEAVYSPNWYSMYEAMGLPRDLWRQADHLWLTHYGEECPRLVAEGKPVLSRLKSRGYILAIVTSGTRSRVLREIDSLGLSDLFPVVVCNEDIHHRKPHPEGLEIAIGRLGTAPESCVYVGDSPEDIEMGKSAGVYTVGIPSGYPTSLRLGSARPDLCLESIGDLPHHF